MTEPVLTQEQMAVLHGLAGLADRYPESNGWGLLSGGLMAVGASMVDLGLLKGSIAGDSKLFKTTPFGETLHAKLVPSRT